MCSMMLRKSNVAKGGKPRTCKVMGGYLNATSFPKFTGHLIPAPKVSSWKEGRNGEKKSALIMAHSACVALIYGLLFGP